MLALHLVALFYFRELRAKQELVSLLGFFTNISQFYLVGFLYFIKLLLQSVFFDDSLLLVWLYYLLP